MRTTRCWARCRWWRRSERPSGGGRSKKTGDVLLRYNFPAAGLTDDALRTLILMVLATGADVRRALVA